MIECRFHGKCRYDTREEKASAHQQALNDMWDLQTNRHPLENTSDGRITQLQAQVKSLFDQLGLLLAAVQLLNEDAEAKDRAWSAAMKAYGAALNERNPEPPASWKEPR